MDVRSLRCSAPRGGRAVWRSLLAASTGRGGAARVDTVGPGPCLRRVGKGPGPLNIELTGLAVLHHGDPNDSLHRRASAHGAGVTCSLHGVHPIES
jgi:hypothetical protein